MAVYEGRQTTLISFPLGGIGSGSVGLAGNGAFRDWEIFNRPFKHSRNGFTHFCVRAEKDGAVEDVRVLQGDYPGPREGGETINVKRGNGGFGYGMGTYRGTMAGVPHFKTIRFEGRYPEANVVFSDEHFPGSVVLRAFNPFIPLNDRDSSMPAAFYEVIFENTTQEPQTYTAYFSMNNLLPYATTRNTYMESNGLKTMVFDSVELSEEDVLYGSFCIGTDAGESSYQEYWYRAHWFDSLETYWRELHIPGPLKNRSYDTDERSKSRVTELDGEDMGVLAGTVTVLPGEKKSVRFVLTWYFPNCINYWNPETDKERPTIWKNYYASLFANAHECACYGLQGWERLYRETKTFQKALYETTLPEVCLDAVSANLSILKSPTCLRLEDGSFYAFEGCNMDEGCCEGSCSHVWNYAYALPFLFPDLERSMRDLEYRYSQRPDGSVSFRLQLPLGRPRYEFRACVDGQMGGVIKVYRDYKICGDKEWLAGKWEAVKKSIEFAWSPTNEDCWDADRDGVMEGRQHHTLDMELFGPSAWLNSFYQAALKAASEIAGILGHHEEEALYARLFRQGRDWVDEHLFNGEYYAQKINLKDKRLLERYNSGESLLGSDSVGTYWNDETGEIKYQIGEGSCVDQVIGQWHARLCGLGDIMDPQKVKKALRSIYRYNYKKNLREVFNPARIYAMNDEGGVQICVWPEGRTEPKIPITYAPEVFCGMEYQVASHLLWEGMTKEAFDIVETIRSRFDGEVRNPWNEFECGSNYARSLASFGLILAASGFDYDMANGYLAFDPHTMENGEFNGFFSVASGWGVYRQKREMCEIELLYGTLKLCELEIPFEGNMKILSVSSDQSEKIIYAKTQSKDGRTRDEKRQRICFETEVALSAGEKLIITKKGQNL